MEKLIEHFMENGEDNEAILECKEQCLNKGIPSCHCEPMMKVRGKLFQYESTGLEPEEIPQWIPVSERLPNPKDMKNITVLTCRKSTITGRTVVLDIARWNGAEWMCKGKELANVTHWQPLPQPPKEEK
jgi:hypothetical protein